MAERWIADKPASTRYPNYTRANAGEVMPDPVSPLTSTLGIPGPGEQGWRDAYVRAGCFDYDEFEPERLNTIGLFGGYLYLNMSLTRIYGVRMPGLTPEMVDYQYFGDMEGIVPYEQEARPTDRSEKHEALMAQYLAELFAKPDWPELIADRDELDRLVARRPDLTTMTEQELVDHARSHLPLYRRLFCRHILVSGASGIGIATVGQVLEGVGRPELLMTLVAGLGDVDSAAPSFAMWELGRLVRASTPLTALFDGGVAGLDARVRGAAAGGDRDAAAFVAGFDTFLARFGSRGPNEWELRSNTWGTNPDLPLAAIERMRLAADADSPSARTDVRVSEREAATVALRSALEASPEALGAFDAGMRVAHQTNAGRERSKTNCIKLTHEIRLPLRELGRRMTERDVFDNAEQVFMLVDDELDLFVEQPDRYRDTVREREATYLSLAEREPPFVTFGAPPPPEQWPLRTASGAVAASVGTALSGIAGCPGVARGRARVVLDPSDPRGLEPGDVLIAPFTDPAWTPLFVPAAAVVVDVGAQITHAVIVSRELGLPCVVSVTGATKRIPDGALVEVDGTAGTVTVLELPA